MVLVALNKRLPKKLINKSIETESESDDDNSQIRGHDCLHPFEHRSKTNGNNQCGRPAPNCLSRATTLFEWKQRHWILAGYWPSGERRRKLEFKEQSFAVKLIENVTECLFTKLFDRHPIHFSLVVKLCFCFPDIENSFIWKLCLF